MMIKTFLFCRLIIWMTIPIIFYSVRCAGQNSTLPIKDWKGKQDSCMVLYISGDGGFNSFSDSFCSGINRTGINVLAIDAKSYFWKRKTPEQTTTDIEKYISAILKRKDQQFVMIGYSFGADVTPFIVNRFSPEIKKKLNSVILLSPSPSTDFEVHLNYFLGADKKLNMDVVKEINMMTLKKKIVLCGEDEDEFPPNGVKLKNCMVQKLPGGHHYDENMDLLIKRVIQFLK
ncbi:AcvB/VirJ family lysyl-phosphatidylglycerol hydrolase [Niabella sp. 22666]|uniref:AcvB/VirJ family lysyl-phosphatidylglycerol hydrolase n=1 Tax=Niabella sp. 22666 TaxID=3453954 RepID=UPI003F839401